METRPERRLHYSQLPPPGPDSQLPVEWNTYRREVGRLLAEGHEGRFVLIKGEEILGLWDTRVEASAEGDRRFLMQGFLVQQVRTWEPLLIPRVRYMEAPPEQRLHYTQLPPPPPNDPGATEWNTFRREVGRLLAEGHEGRFALIKGEQIVGIWDSRREALDEGYRRFLMQGFRVQQIRTWEPLLIPFVGYM
jgi:hypothetical protein